jgi:FtsP/CotA-like multicopper oxidase with cupredoxin domain
MRERNQSGARNADSDATASKRTSVTRRGLLRGGAIAVGGALVGAASPRSSSAQSAREGDARPPYVPAPGAATVRFRIDHTPIDPDGKQVVESILVNGSYPAPELRLQEGQIARLEVSNAMRDVKTSIHWHGLLVPAGMDGVPGVSGFSIEPQRVFVYEFPIRQRGTYWYHSHSGLQEQRGLAGPIVIEARHEPLHYEHDAVIFITDWLHRDPSEIVPMLRKKNASQPAMDGMKMDGAKPNGMTDGMSMGGMAKPDLADVAYDAYFINGKSPAAPWTLAARPGDRVRLRLVNAGASTYFRVSLDGHPLEVTHADGIAIRPFVVDEILLGMAECYDVVVKLGASGSHTLHAVTQDGSGQAVGVLHTPDAKPVVNDAKPAPGKRQLSYAQLQALESTQLSAGPDRELRIALQGDMRNYLWKINGQMYPDADPLLVRQGERVHVELVNETGMWHPMHLHGHFFRLLNGAGELAPLKHTVNVEPNATVRFEFLADNPGGWFFHCHNLYHFEAGMARVFQYTA